MKGLILIFITLFTISGFSQKDTSRSFDAAGIEKIYIYTDEVFKINLKTSDKPLIILTSHSEGEYFNDISLDAEVLQDRMVITSNFREILQSGFDKLSAHKVFSLEISLEIPEGLEVFIKSNIASVNGSGRFKKLEVELKSGACDLEVFYGDLVINTYNGSITVETFDAEIIAHSRNGEIFLPPATPGKNQIKLTSINGNIRVREN